jgi:hypothetical protein
MRHLSKINVTLALILSFLIGSLVGLSVNLGWGLPLGTSLTLVIATLGFGVAFYQSYSTRKHNRLLVKPHLLIKSPISSIQLEGYYTFTLMVKNSGLGPALIKKFSISIGDDGEIVNGTLLDTIRKHARDHFSAKGKTRCLANFLQEGDAIDKGEEKILIQINFAREGVHPNEARQLSAIYSSRIKVNIDYHCHYGQKFKSERLATQIQQTKPDLLTIASTE